MRDVTPRLKSAAKARRSPSAASLKKKATKAWGEFVHARDKTCVTCGRADGKLDAHHVMIREHNATRTDEDNGILVCFRCHQKLHSDPHWAATFYTDWYGAFGYAALREKAYMGKDGKYPASFWQAELDRLQSLLEEIG